MKTDQNQKKYSIVYADPPWQYNTNECVSKKSTLSKTNSEVYPTMRLEDLKKINVKKIINDKECLLFMWVVSPMLKEGIELLESWGFSYITVAFVWYKQRHSMGHYTLAECELCILGKIGKIPTPRGSTNISQFLSQKRGDHSSKPHEIRKRIMKMFPSQNKLEMFARGGIMGFLKISNLMDGMYLEIR